MALNLTSKSLATDRMRLIKKMDLFMLQTFLPLFAMTFLIVTFIVLMQSLWKWIDALVGKGVGMEVIGELFFYAAVSAVPMVLPLALLLASLMTFGNLGEKFELTAMKSSGISLIRVMKPLIVMVVIISIGAFFFQNYVLPEAQVKMWTLVFSLRQKSPEVEIPENVFYGEIPGYNLLVREKNKDTGMLKDVMIYDVTNGDNATILLADSARMAMTADMNYLYLHLFEGEQFENLRGQRTGDRNVPFRRETFFDKEILIPFDANFNRLDEQGMRSQYVGKNISELRHSIDSIGHRVDSIGAMFSMDLRRDPSPILPSMKSTIVEPDSREADDNTRQWQHRREEHDKEMAERSRALSVDSALKAMPPAEASQLLAQALSISGRHQAEIEFKSLTMDEDKKNIRRHGIELIKKYTLSLACIIFFFIGAPLGAIIRKGGLGTPMVISILLFVFYYIFDNAGNKMAREGRWPVEAGVWLSTMVLTPLAAYVTWKAMNDSSALEMDRYKEWFRRLFGLRRDRYVPQKEVIITDIDLLHGRNMLQLISSKCKRLLDAITPGGNIFQRYWSYYTVGIPSASIRGIEDDTEKAVEYLSDCRNLKVGVKLQELPVLRGLWIYNPCFSNRYAGYVAVLLLPISIPLWLYGEKCLRNLRHDLKKTRRIISQTESLL